MVARMLSSVGPPVAMMGISGWRSRSAATSCGVSDAAETFRMSTPAAIRASVSCVAETMVATTGMSMCDLMSRRISAETGALSTTP